MVATGIVLFDALCLITPALRTREKSFPNFCNVKNSGMTFLWPPPHKVASTRTVTATLFPAVKLAAEVFLFDGGALVVDLLAFG